MYTAPALYNPFLCARDTSPVPMTSARRRTWSPRLLRASVHDALRRGRVGPPARPRRVCMRALTFGNPSAKLGLALLRVGPPLVLPRLTSSSPDPHYTAHHRTSRHLTPHPSSLTPQPSCLYTARHHRMSPHITSRHVTSHVMMSHYLASPHMSAPRIAQRQRTSPRPTSPPVTSAPTSPHLTVARPTSPYFVEPHLSSSHPT